MAKTMMAAVLEAFGKDLIIKNLPIPKPGKGEVLLKIKASALCVSDIHIQDGRIPTVKIPLIPGHEMAGEIVSVGEGVNYHSVGERVLVLIDITCGHCRFCKEQRSNLCTNLVRIGFERNGSHAEYCVVPADNVFNIGDIPFEQAACLMDAVGCMYNAIKRQGQVKAGDRVMILGVGGIGMNAIMIAKMLGAEVYATSRNDKKLEIAKKLGADYVINTRKENLPYVIRQITNNKLCDVIIDNIGIHETVNDAVHLVRPGGKVLVAGYYDKTFEVDFQELMKYEKEIIGIRGIRRTDITEVINLLKQKKLEPYIFCTMPFADINKALKMMREGKNMGRIVLMMPEKGG